MRFFANLQNDDDLYVSYKPLIVNFNEVRNHKLTILFNVTGQHYFKSRAL
jgi:hypothetical protein